MPQHVNSHNSRFMERWSRAEHINSRLTAVAVALSCLCAALAAGLVYMTMRPRPIYYIPGVLEAGVARPQAVPYATVGSFAAAWTLNWCNFTPATVQDAYARAGRLMAPPLAARTQARLDRDVDEVRRNNISSLFSLNGDPQVDRSGRGFRVVLEGNKGIYVGKEEIKEQRMVFTLNIRQVPPTDGNPYGLMIEDINQEEK